MAGIDEVVEDQIPFEPNNDELEGLALLFLETACLSYNRLCWRCCACPIWPTPCSSEIFARAGTLFTGYLSILRISRSWYKGILAMEKGLQFHWRKNYCCFIPFAMASHTLLFLKFTSANLCSCWWYREINNFTLSSVHRIKPSSSAS